MTEQTLKKAHNEAAIFRRVHRQYFLNKYNNKCAHCSSTERLELDHVIPICAGGKSIRSNIQVLCKSCNCRKGGCRDQKKQDKLDPNSNTRKLVSYPNTIHKKLKISAKKNGRTIMAEIREILIQWAK